MKPTIRTMQPNPHGVIPGTQAKEFFEKSRLPIQVRLSETVINDTVITMMMMMSGAPANLATV